MTTSVPGELSALRARSQSACFVCGRDNPRGMRLHYERRDSGEFIATWTPESTWEGFQGIVHGGIVSTVLDEAMSKAVMAAGWEALTAELRVRFRRPVASGADYSIRGWIAESAKRMVKTEAVLVSRGGVEHAHAWAVFLPVNARGLE